MTDTFYARELDPNHPGLNPNLLSRRGELRKKQRDKNDIKQWEPLCTTSPALGGIAEASQPRAPRVPRVPHSMVSPKRPDPWHDQNSPRAGWVGGWARK